MVLVSLGQTNQIMIEALGSRLGALSYVDHVDPKSAPLVQKLLDDLVRTRQDFVQLKQQAGRQAHDLVGADEKARAASMHTGVTPCADLLHSHGGPTSTQLQVSAVRQDTVRQQAENSQLHIRLIQEAEKYDRQEKSHYQQTKKLEDKIAELTYWKQSASEKLVAAERESSSLRRKMEALVKLTDKLSSGHS